NFQSHQLPTIRCHNRLLSSKFKELIINTIMLLLNTFSRKSRQIRYTINILRNIRLHQFTYSRQKIPKCRNMISNYPLWNNSRPLNDERSTDTSFIYISFLTPERSITVKIRWIVPSLRMDSIIGSKNNYRMIIQTFLF